MARIVRITDEVNSGEHELPRPLKKPGGIKGLKLTMIPIVTWTVYILCKKMVGAIKTKRIRKVDRMVNETGRITEQNQCSKELDKPIANYVQDTSVPGTTAAETTPSHGANLRTAETQWVSTRKWNKSGDISDKTIGEIRKAIYDEFNNNIRILMCSKRSIPRMTVEPQKRRTVRIPKKWTEPTKIRGSIYPKQMGPDVPSTRPRTTESVFLF